MQSVTRLHYPQVSFREGRKELWNPVLKKAFKSRPEERVRMRLVEYLIYEAKFSASRLSFESPVSLPGDRSSSRTDLIAYDGNFKPLLLAECKAPDISLDEKAAQQIARYNSKIGAPYLLITNGRNDHWYSIEKDQVLPLDDIPESFTASVMPDRSFSYWTQRGFTAEQEIEELRNWVLQSCRMLYLENGSAVYLSFEEMDPVPGLSNYYGLFDGTGSSRLGLSLSATADGSTRLTGILNQDGANTALLNIALKPLWEHENENAVILSEKGSVQLNIQEKGFSLRQPLLDQLSLLNKILLEQA